MTDDAHFRLRLPQELHAEITRAAQANRRTLNAEIVARLSQDFDFASKIQQQLDGLVVRLRQIEADIKRPEGSEG